MSLVSLTFNSDNSIVSKYQDVNTSTRTAPVASRPPTASSETEITQKLKAVNPLLAAQGPAKFVLKKVDQFFGLDDVVLLGHVEVGTIKTGMSCQVNGCDFQVVEVESKIGKIAKKGLAATVVINGGVGGVGKDAFEGVEEVTFS